MSTMTLLPCPWCGCELSSVSVSEGSTLRWRKVDGCCTDGPEVWHDTMANDQAAAEADSEERAIEAWNNRARLAQPAQATTCAGCGEHKATPLRIDAMGGYVCLTCIDQKLSSLLGEFGYPEPQPAQAVDVVAIREVIADMDCDMDMPVTADAWRDKLTLAISGEKSGPVDGWISVTDRLPECDMTPNSFGVPVEVKPGFFDGVRRVPNAFYGCRQTDRPNFYLYGAVFYPTHWRYPASPAPDKEG